MIDDTDTIAEDLLDAEHASSAESLPPVIAAPANTADAAPGTTNTVAGQRIDEGKGRIFPCERCGADLTFHIGQQQLECPFCGYARDLTHNDDAVTEQDFHGMLAHLAELRAAGTATGVTADREVSCDACGATVRFDETVTSSECAFCGSPVQRERVHDAPARVPVDGVLPFRIERKTARANLAAWVKSRWFAPNEFKRRGARGKFSGVYLPYWTFDSMTFSRYAGMRGRHYWVTVGSGKNKRRVRRTSWTPASGSVSRFFDDVMALGARIESSELARNLEPWPLDAVVPFTQEALAGFVAQTYDIELDVGFVAARERIDAAIYSDVCHDIGGDTQRVHSIDTSYDALTYKHLLLPVWLLSYRYREKVYPVIVNAGTGEVQGRRPWSWVKILLTVVCGLVGLGGAAAVIAASS